MSKLGLTGMVALPGLELTIGSSTQESDDEHPDHDRSGEPQQQQEQHADQHGYDQPTDGGREQKERQDQVWEFFVPHSDQMLFKLISSLTPESRARQWQSPQRSGR